MFFFILHTIILRSCKVDIGPTGPEGPYFKPNNSDNIYVGASNFISDEMKKK